MERAYQEARKKGAAAPNPRISRSLSRRRVGKLVAEVRKKIDALGIEYLYLQFISVTGRIMGKGIPADHWESVAKKGFQLVYGATMNLFLNRRGDYLGYGPKPRNSSASQSPRPSCSSLGQAGGAALVHAVPQPRGARRSRRLPHRRCARQSSPPARAVPEGPRAAASPWHRARDDVARRATRAASRTAATPIPIAITSTSSRACGPFTCRSSTIAGRWAST